MKLKWYILLAILSSAFGAAAQCTTPISTFPYTEDFETSDGNWIIGGNAPDWAWGQPNKDVIRGAGSGNLCWITGGTTGGSYTNGQNSWLRSPCFDFTTLVHPQISFLVFWETERRFDGADIQYSTDGGTNWQTIGSNSSTCTSVNWYNNTAVTYLGGGAGWSGNVQPTSGSCLGGSGSGTWLAARHELEALAGRPSVIFRFRFGAGTTCNDYNGFAIDKIEISEAPTGPANFTYTCGTGNSMSFTSITPTCPVSYAWDFGDTGSGSNNTSSDANPTHQFSTTGPFTITLTVTYASGPPSVITHSIELIGATISTTQPITCGGGSNGALSVTATGSSTPYSYVWNTSPPQTGSSVTGLGAGMYTVLVSSSSATCPLISNITLAEPPLLIVNPVPTNAVCTGNNGSIDARVTGGTPGYTYTWSNGGSTAMISNLAAGSYDLTVKDNNGCTVITNGIIVGRTNRTVPVSLGNSGPFCPGQAALVLTPGTTFSSYLWQDNSTAPTFIVNAAGTYSVRVTDSEGCTGSASVTITADCGDIYFPGAFTPNGDGRNDYFGAFGNTAAVTDYRFRIFDRWGTLVFATSNPSRRWDGSFFNKRYNTGAFTWFATYTLNGRPRQEQHGTVLILR